MNNIFEKAREASDYILESTELRPRVATILGTGLGSLTEELEEGTTMAYERIPHFPISTVKSHAGAMHIGRLNGIPIAILSGRFHYYEGYSAKEITFPVRVLKSMGIEKLIITNVSGGLNPHYKAGQLILVEDHINLQPEHPLRGKNDDRLGLRFPDMMEPYNLEMRSGILQAAESLDYRLSEGVYVAVQGPSLETRAEYKFLRKIGADMVGMSSVPEVIVANHAEIQVAMISMISNVCFPVNRISKTTLEEVIAVAAASAPMFNKLLSTAIEYVMEGS